MSATFYIGDNTKIIPRYIADASIDLVYFNPPFGTTQHDWDEQLDWPLLFKEFYRVLKPDGIIAIHCSVPFNYTLIRSAPQPPSHTWYWKKECSTNPLLAKIQPLRNTEEILVWTNKKHRYYPQRVGTEKRMVGGNLVSKSDKKHYYGNSHSIEKKEVIGKYQTHFIEMKREIDGFSTRPKEIIELILNSYSKEGDTILDPTCYRGLAGQVAKRMNRNYIGIDKNFYPMLYDKEGGRLL